jgi:DNA-binding transcriptional MerR regulator
MRNASPLTIRRLSQQTGVTLRALRHYETLGLLRPIRADRGKRLYPQGECARAIQIARLRRMDLSLPLIQSILDRDCDHDRNEALRQALSERLAELESQTPMVRAALSELGPTSDWARPAA